MLLEKTKEPTLGKSLVLYPDGETLYIAPFPLKPESLNGSYGHANIRVFLPYQRSVTLAHMIPEADYMGKRTIITCGPEEEAQIRGIYEYLWGRGIKPDGSNEEVLFLAEKATGNEKLKNGIETIEFCPVSLQLDMEL